MATLVVSQPGWLAAALAVACVAAASVRVARRGRRLVAALLSIALIAMLGSAVGALLVTTGGPGAQLLLGALTIAGGLWLTTEMYRREATVLSTRTRFLLTGVRLGAWLVLLMLLARPAWERTLLTWEKPVLAVLLDHSASMASSDQRDEAGPVLTRAALANAAIADAGETIERLHDLYDVRLRRVGARPDPASAWEIIPDAPLTGLAAALRDARELRSAKGRPPVAVLLISDGAENVADSEAVRQAAEDLAGQRTALLGVGVGPEPGQAPVVELEPLVVPPRVRVRDMLHVAVAGRVQGCRGQALSVELLWNEEVGTSSAVPVDYDMQHIQPEFDVLPPGPGAHRLTVRVTLPAVLGGHSFTSSAIVEVAADQVRVLYVEQGPRTESAFVTRALRGDATIKVTQHFLFDDDSFAGPARNAAELWTGYDVVVLGRVRTRLPRPAWAALAEAVTVRGVGLLLSGGSGLFNSREYARTPLADVSPVRLSDRELGRTREPRFVPTAAGLRHPVLQQAADDGADGIRRSEAGSTPAAWAGAPPFEGGGRTGADELAAWTQLPALGGAAVLGRPKPVAIVMAVDEQDRPLLVGHEVGRGRCIAAAWESTWPWVLASEEGGALHSRLWRQMVVWLANRRPRAWVVTDQPRYALAPLAGGERRIRIRAGVTGLSAAMPAVRREDPSASLSAALEATLTLRQVRETDKVTEPVAVKLEQSGDVWLAELPQRTGPRAVPAPGTYLLEFALSQPNRATSKPIRARAGSAAEEDLIAHTQFVVADEDLEHRAPTANLSLLRAAAERTTGCGGLYCDVAALPEVLEELAQQDRRERVATRVCYDLVNRDPWGLLLSLTVLLAVEWVVRKRGGLS